MQITTTVGVNKDVLNYLIKVCRTAESKKWSQLADLGSERQQQEAPLPLRQQLRYSFRHKEDKVLQHAQVLDALLAHHLPHGGCQQAEGRDEETQGGWRESRGWGGGIQDGGDSMTRVEVDSNETAQVS